MRTPSLRSRAWWVMRRHGVFSLSQLLDTVVLGHEASALENLMQYMRALIRAGILKVERDGRLAARLGTPGVTYFHVVEDVGRRAPVVRGAARVVFDPNEGGVYALR